MTGGHHVGSGLDPEPTRWSQVEWFDAALERGIVLPDQVLVVQGRPDR